MGFLGDLTNTLSSAAGVMAPMGAIAGGISALGSLFGSSAEDKAMALAEKQHQWDVEENEKNRQFQRDEWSRQFNEINAYNDPAAAKERLTKAGLNGSALLNGSGSAVGNSSASPSSPSGAHGLNPMPDVVSQVGFQSQESLSNRLRILSELGKSSALLPDTKAKLSAEVENVLADTKYKDIRAKSEEFALSLDKLLKPIERSVGIQNALKTLVVADADIRLKGAQASEADARAAQLAEEKLLTIAKRNLSQKDFERLELEVKWYGKLRQQEINESRSRESANYASAEESRANAAQIKFWNDINNRPDVKHELVRAAKEAGKAAVNANAISERQARQLDYMIEQAAFAADMKEFTYWSNQVSSWVESVGNAASQFYGAGALRELIRLRQKQQAPIPHVSGFGN